MKQIPKGTKNAGVFCSEAESTSRFGTTAREANSQEQALAWRPGIRAFRPSEASYAGSAGLLSGWRAVVEPRLCEGRDTSAALGDRIEEGTQRKGAEARRLAENGGRLSAEWSVGMD